MSSSKSAMSSSPPSTAPLLQSPNAIPPRTSSTGPFTVPHPPSKSVLRPVPEADWISNGGGSLRRQHQNPPQQQQQHHGRSKSASATTGSPTPVPVADAFSSSFHPVMPSGTPPDPGRYATEDFNFTTSKRTWTQEKEKVVTGPFDYLNGRPGKDFRRRLISAFNTWLEVPPDSIEIITKVVGMLHTASLLVDDVEDSSLLRRGLPVAHNIFGVPQTINSANYVYFCAMQEVQKLRNPKAIAVFGEELLNLHRGQGMDLYWRDSLTCPTEDDYLEMVGNKTGGLFRLGIKLMQAESPSSVDCVPLVNIIGLIFQITDDYQNLFSKEYSENKGMCEDLTEGKFSFPVIHSIRSDPTNLQLLNILRQKTTDEEVKRYAVRYMEATGSFEYTRKVLDVLLTRARRMAEEMDDGRGQSAGIYKILDRIVI